MKYFLNILFLVSFWNCFSQNSYPTEPKEYSKIHFVYEEKSNFYLDDKGVYADTLLIANDFPNLKYTKVKSPTKANAICGFVPYSDFAGQDKRRIVSSLYHHYETYEGTYDVKKQKTKMKVTRENKEIKEKVKKYFNEYFEKVVHKFQIDYTRENQNIIYKTWSGMLGDKEERVEKKEVFNFNEEKLIGLYKIENQYVELTNIVVFNKMLNTRITPETLFSNVIFGVEKIITLSSTYELKSVTYE